ncbi:hypothetical protein AB0I28_03435 [Phytomonospora sp. NPDC050363]|uniref:hypothetical protein n=1 Tax=Phytomonospora sp. NPDC050363 TaxID=3155642 RepID=UPI0033C49451
MDAAVRRSPLPAPLTPLLVAVAAAVLAAGQVALAELCGLSELGGEFQAGAERTESVNVTLLTWFCALSAPTATLLAYRSQWLVRVVSALFAAAATTAALPVAQSYAGDVLASEIPGAVGTGAVLGAFAALLTVALTALGLGVALHAGLLWVLAFLASLASVLGFTWGTPTFFAGYVLDGLADDLGIGLPLSGRTFGYFPSRSQVTIVALLVFAAVVAALAVLRTGSWWHGFLVGAAGPVLALAPYLVDTSQLVMWNADILPLLSALTGLGVLITGIASWTTARRFRRAERTEEAEEAEAAEQ